MSSYSQYQLKIKFNNGAEKIDNYKAKGWNLTSLTTGKKYHLNEMKEVTYYSENDSIHYYVIDTKTYLKSKKSRKNLARKKFEGKNIELYYVYFNWTQNHTNGVMSNNSYDEAFVKKKNEKFAYNIGYIYGAGYKGIKKRVRKYFSDCPDLINKVNKNKIKKKNTLGIVEYYNKNCAE
tara:strand:- start:27 stop:560 length:534 start_codon:yes stop_codon:yes gene_type:complete